MEGETEVVQKVNLDLKNNLGKAGVARRLKKEIQKKGVTLEIYEKRREAYWEAVTSTVSRVATRRVGFVRKSLFRQIYTGESGE